DRIGPSRERDGVAARVPGARGGHAIDCDRHTSEALANVILAIAVQIVEDHAGQERAGAGRASGVNRIIIYQRPEASLDDADADLVLALVHGVDRQQLPAMAEIGNAVVDDQGAQCVAGVRISRAAGDALAPAVPEKSSLG